MRINGLVPIEGPVFQGRFWPLDTKQIETLEGVLGWTLPEDYRLFIQTHAGSTPGEFSVIETRTEAGAIPVDLFRGATTDEGSSLIHRADDYKSPHQLLVFAEADNGLFFMNPDGEILFELHGYNQLYAIASNFTDFFERIAADSLDRAQIRE